MAVFTAAATIGASVLGSLGFTAAFATGVTFATVAVGFLTQAAIGIALNALTPKPRTSGANRGYQVTTRGSALDHQIIYGRMRTGGVIVYDKTTGTNNKFLHRVIAFAGHEVESFDEVYIDDEVLNIGGYNYEISFTYDKERKDGPVTLTGTTTLTGVPTESATEGPTITLTEYDDLKDAAAIVEGTSTIASNNVRDITIDSRVFEAGAVTNTKYGGLVRINQHYGSSDQEADSDLIAEVDDWTAQHRLRGIAYLYIRLQFDQNAFPNGVPDITATVNGKKVYDPREASHDEDDPDTWEWSDNPCLCLRDYLSSGYGLSEKDVNIDDDLVSTGANVCDDTDTISGEKRFTCNGAFVTQVTPIDMLNDLLTSMGGLLWYAQGQWRMKPAYYVVPTLTFTEDDLRSNISVRTRHSRRDNFNTVKGTFRGEESNWQVTDYPEVSNSAFVTADNGQESTLDLELPFTDNADEARRIARIVLERNRQQLTVSASFGLRAFQVQTGDIIKLSVERFGWAEKEFEVTSWTFGLTDAQDLQVQMTLREISESVFDEIDDGIVYERDNTTLLSPFDVPSVGINATATTQVLREKLTNVLNVDVSSGRPEAIDRVEVEFKGVFEDEYVGVGTGELGLYRIVDLETGDYDIRARAINTFGIKGEFSYFLGVSADGLLDPPNDVSGLTAEVNGATIHLEWEPVADLDLSYYQIRHSVEETGATWADATTAVDKVPRPSSSVSLPTRPGTYHIKAIDKSGISSENYTSVVVSAADIQDFANTDTQTEEPTFGGSKTGCSVVSELVGAVSINTLQITDPSSAPSEATYDFSNYVDTGSVRKVRSRIETKEFRKNNTDGFWDDLPGLFDDIPGLFDSFGSDFADTNVQAFISTTNDDPAGTPTWSAYRLFRAGDYSGRAFRFRVVLRSTSDDITPAITGLKAIVEYD